MTHSAVEFLSTRDGSERLTYGSTSRRRAELLGDLRPRERGTDVAAEASPRSAAGASAAARPPGLLEADPRRALAVALVRSSPVLVVGGALLACSSEAAAGR